MCWKRNLQFESQKQNNKINKGKKELETPIRLVTPQLKGRRVSASELGLPPLSKKLTEEAKRIWAEEEPKIYVSFS